MKNDDPQTPYPTNGLPLVTLITPTYNQAHFLAETIDSVLAQDYPYIEYIVLDDGSTDNTPDVLRRYNGRIRWERHENMGQSATLNKGWRASRGQILGYISSDDRLKSDAVSASVKAFKSHPNVIVTYPDFTLIDALGIAIREVKTEAFSRQRLVDDLVCLPGPGAFFRRSAFDAEGGWSQHLRQIPDFDFWIRLSRLGEFHHIDRVLADYRLHEESASYRPVCPKRADEIIEIIDLYWTSTGHDHSLNPLSSRSMANVLSARLHFISGRYGGGLKRLANAASLCPRRFTEAVIWRIIAAGLFRRLYYGLIRRSAK